MRHKILTLRFGLQARQRVLSPSQEAAHRKGAALFERIAIVKWPDSFE